MNNVEKLKHIWSEWRIVEHIGTGSYGQVYKVVRDEYSTPIYSAVKIITIPNNTEEILELKAEGLDEKALKEYFRQKVKNYISEIEIMEAFKGTANIVNIEDYEVVEKSETIGFDIYIRMELLMPLNEYIQKNVLTQKDIIKLGIDICCALELFEQKNIIHRDIKPENLFVSEYGDFKIGDLGIARKLNSDVAVLSAKGTYSYMAPEVVWGKPYNIRADIYSLGIVLYRLCNKNRLPFVNMESDEIDIDERKSINYRRLKGEKLPKPVNADDDMAVLILRACEYNADKRFQTTTEFKNALITIDNGGKIILSYRSFTKIKLKVVISIIIFFLLCVLGSLLIWGNKENVFPILHIGEFVNNEYDSKKESQGTTEIEEIEPEEMTDTETEEIEPEEMTDTETEETEPEEMIDTEIEETELIEPTESEMDETESEKTTESETESKKTTESETESKHLITEPAETTPPIVEETEYEGYIVPKGCTYSIGEETYSGGMKVDVPPTIGHILQTKDYKYYYSELLYDVGDENSYCGWNVEVLNHEQSEYEELIDCIAGEKLLIMSDTYRNCTNMKKAPEIPDGVEVMTNTYFGCKSLELAPVIPENVKIMYYAFYDCDSLRIVPAISDSVENMMYTFYNCKSLITVTNIPDNVTNMTYTFAYCTELQKVPKLPQYLTNMEGTFVGCDKLSESPEIPPNVTNLKYTFSGCSSLYIAPEIPKKVLNMDNTFSLCENLKTGPVIPESVANMIDTFKNCINLTGEVVINANPTVCNDCFSGVDFSYQNLTLTGSSTMLEELRSTSEN